MNVTESAAWTAIGTLALAVITVLAVITTIVITITDRRRAYRQLAAERDADRELEQLQEAYAVQVLLGDRMPARDASGRRGETGYRLAAIVINRGRYTITGVDARLRLSGPGNPSIVGFAGKQRLTAIRDLDPKLRDGMFSNVEEMDHTDRLAPWDLGLRFASDGLSGKDLPGTYPVVRWTDRWGTRWEHRRGEVRQVCDGLPWLPDWMSGERLCGACGVRTSAS